MPARVAALVLALLASSSLSASAQTAFEDGEVVVDAELADALYLRDVGMALTISGVATTASGTGLMLGLRDWSGIIGGGTFEGIGGVLSLIGIPMWIVGGVRSEILGARASDRDRVAWDYELAGMATTLLGLASAAAGIAMFLTGQQRDWGIGGVMFPIGVFVAFFIGTPMWAEGARF